LREKRLPYLPNSPRNPPPTNLHRQVYGTKFKIDKKYVPIKALGKGAQQLSYPRPRVHMAED
jgi:hypothetical protein